MALIGRMRGASTTGSFLAYRQTARCSSYNEVSGARSLARAPAPAPQDKHTRLTPTVSATVPGFKQRLGTSRHHTTSLRILNLPLSESEAKRAHNCCFVCASLHTWQPLRSKAKPKDSGTQHGSVLAQFVGKKEEPKQVTVATKVVQAGKDMTYLVVIVAGFALTGFLFWSVGSEFFSSNSPSAIFTQALKRVKNDPRVTEMLGEPITGHGEHSGRGRRRHIAHQEYIVDDVTYMRLKFYVDGSRRKGTATIDLKKNDRGKYVCRFLMVEIQGAAGAIIIEDNR